MKTIKHIFLKHYLKFVSFIISIFLWSIAKNTYFPETPFTHTIGLTLINEDVLTENNYVLANKTELLNKQITIRGQAKIDLKEELDLKKSLIKAEVNLAPIVTSYMDEMGKPIEVDVNIRLPVLDNSYLFYYSERTVNVILDRKIEVDKTVEVEKINRAPTDYYDSDEITVIPDQIQVSGAKTTIDSIDKLKVSIDIENKTKDVTAVCDIIVIDKDGEDITDSVQLSSETVEVTIPIYKYGNAIIENPSYVGNPAEGYTLTDIIYEPKRIRVYGTEQDIANMEKIDLENVNIEGASEDVTNTVDLYDYLTNRGLFPYFGSTTTVTSTFKIEPLVTETITIPVDDITRRGSSHPSEINVDAFEITVSAVEEKMNELKQKQILVYIDLTNYEPGDYEIEPVILMPVDGVTFEASPINVTIYQSQESSE